jgi:Tfp pilus assembly protein PilX
MKTKGKPSRRGKNRGAVLLLALVFMLMLAMIAATVMQTAVMQLHMAGNDQFLEEAFYQAQAIVTEVSVDIENFSMEDSVGASNCPVGGSGVQCDRRELHIAAAATTVDGVAVDYRVTRLEPLLWRGFPIRESQDRASSSDSFDAAIFEISARIDGSDAHLGNAHIVRGVALRVPVVH